MIASQVVMLKEAIHVFYKKKWEIFRDQIKENWVILSVSLKPLLSGHLANVCSYSVSVLYILHDV